MTIPKTRDELAIIRALCDESLLFFTRFFYKELQGSKFIPNWHHEEICEALKEVERYELDYLGINIPPRHSKTELGAVNFIARGIGMNPKANYLYITASDELRAETSVRIRDIVSHPYFQTMYGVDLKKDQNGKNLWRTTQGGGLKTATIFGQITGFGAGQMIEHIDSGLLDFIRDFEGAIILDDINKIDDTESNNAINEKVTRILFNTIMSRKNSKDTPIINIQQRAGITDATAEFMEHYGENNPRAKFLVLPIIINGEPLWEWKHSMADIELLRTSPKTSNVFDTQYMQDPKPRFGILFPKDELQRFRRSDIDVKNKVASIAFVDVADTGSDHHCALFGKIIGSKIYIDDVVFTKEPTETNTVMTIQAANDNVPEFMQVESNFGGTMYVQLLTNNSEVKLNGSTALVPVNASQNKHTRIITASGFIKMHFVFLDESEYENGSEYDLFMRNLCQYTKTKGATKHDDAPDACAGLAKMALLYYSHIWGITIAD
jgi:predicted phage terminase large subunit-like protein